ncbi:hypothetical protein GIB67_034301 [Kingdonia uniflora]|uniref:Ribosomal protein eL8/eL30/eS12/Gadd45 domain-containing protein n=1 Tax=Kingdonia uniflora TaxID=39325 RepID=A0A7J7NRW8_9MAGN|nr:hypothetical protein GIB67_034301 [Kingdonia uniflora]
MRKKNKESKSIVKAPESVSTTEQQSNCCEGERLVYFLKSLNSYYERPPLAIFTRSVPALELFHLMFCSGMKPVDFKLVWLWQCSKSLCKLAISIREMEIHSRITTSGLRVDHCIGSALLQPQLEHYACRVDVIRHSGRVNEALLICEMSFEAGMEIWRTLLKVCRIHGNVEVAERAPSSILHLDPQGSAAYENGYGPQIQLIPPRATKQRYYNQGCPSKVSNPNLSFSGYPGVYKPCDDSFALVYTLLADRVNLLKHQPMFFKDIKGVFIEEFVARLDDMVQERELESAKLSKGTLPDNIWIKQQFSIGVNDVTRVLERMKPISDLSDPSEDSGEYKASQVRLQAVLLATDCNPRWLTKHLPSLASSRKVPIISIRDKKGGSLRLGEILKLKTAIAIGVKARGTCINKLIEEILHSNLANIGDKELSEVS